ncbi:uncharacterized protein N0V89_012103 [Didymosphaeria variabile]|uniref:Uncharacterized protein n=1 Tax=Didymosphaeria variabile TaxID=1932322 RepID=A0A9W8X8M4_9PLEO|nr:uncharacterized protein N0V89_012103 [Didymosphaeria variabile]KAJ4344363.1 hypothetical protein N0V89_012103 [Didymosphaeria variabile]
MNHELTTEHMDMIAQYDENMSASMTRINDIVAMIEGLPAAVEGDFGVYAKKTKPAVPPHAQERLDQHALNRLLVGAQENHYGVGAYGEMIVMESDDQGDDPEAPTQLIETSSVHVKKASRQKTKQKMKTEKVLEKAK